ncbi:DUF2779 domain-containing protein [uncultured Draconibacterium sp.]|uniref:DUF2779 domain-containing protein n=1 Tax=uncultured Draconibacterium sp. TaxID=1573823 RepID=UPI0025D6578E|nr:DUF2779 domain-containing protein [uncultured Draconibacterium sp.]
MRYLTKSRFKLAEECPTKLYYTRKKEYPDKSVEDPFLAALAEGGFQVGELAKCYFPGGIDIKSLDYNEVLEQTNALLTNENAIIYEAAIRYKNLFIRADVLVKQGNKFYLHEVKAKSCDFDDETGFLSTKGFLAPAWKPYVHDVAFQKYVLTRAFPQMQVFSYLMLVDKTKTATANGLNQKFQLTKNDTGRTEINVTGDTSLQALGEKLLISINVDNLVSKIWSGSASKTPPAISFEKSILHFATNYETDTKIDSPITPDCWKCQFTCTPEEEASGLKSGFKECLQNRLGWNDAQFMLPTVIEVWDNRSKKKLFENGKIFMHQLSENDLKDSAGGTTLSRTERQWLQVNRTVNKDNTAYLDKVGLKDLMDSFAYPLHFIDFETSMVAIPFNAGRKPYEQTAFQFSHHTMDADGNVKHAGQFLFTEKGKFPNYDFLRSLKKELEQDEGTIFRYAAHENTVLNQIYIQLINDDSISATEKEELKSFIREITTSSNQLAEQWEGPRKMVDMLQLVKEYYYDPLMKGSNSIKVVLPTILQTSDYIHDKYSQAIYGKNSAIKSLNFEDDWIWIQKDANGKTINPYKLLPALFEGVERTEDFLTDSAYLADGGAAMTAYMKMQFSNMTKEEREALIHGLLRYCELDTLAMVMIFEAWREWIKESD